MKNNRYIVNTIIAIVLETLLVWWVYTTGVRAGIDYTLHNLEITKCNDTQAEISIQNETHLYNF